MPQNSDYFLRAPITRSERERLRRDKSGHRDRDRDRDKVRDRDRDEDEHRNHRQRQTNPTTPSSPRLIGSIRLGRGSTSHAHTHAHGHGHGHGSKDSQKASFWGSREPSAPQKNASSTQKHSKRPSHSTTGYVSSRPSRERDSGAKHERRSRSHHTETR